METVKFEDAVKYVYGQLDNLEIQEVIKNSLDNSDKEIIETIRDINLVKLYRGFTNSEQHINSIKLEVREANKRLFETFDSSPLNDEKKEYLNRN